MYSVRLKERELHRTHPTRDIWAQSSLKLMSALHRDDCRLGARGTGEGRDVLIMFVGSNGVNL